MVINIEELYAIIGNPLEHSFSPSYFNEMFRRNKINAVYEPWRLDDIIELPGRLVDAPALRGFNVTIPFKKEVMRFLDHIDSSAKTAGAVNTVRVIHNNGTIRLEGYNTDIIGFCKALDNFLPENELSKLSSLNTLILGTGGASSAVKVALKEMGIDSLTVTRSKTDSQKKYPHTDLIEYRDLTPEMIWEHRLIVNTTPAGMYPDIMSVPPFPWEYLSEHHYFFDLIYNPETTLAMKIAQAHGAKVTNGLEMLYAQADAAWQIWQK